MDELRRLIDQLEAITKYGYMPMPASPKTPEQQRFDEAEKALRNGIRPPSS